MSKNKNNQAIWNTRIKDSSSLLFQNVGSSIDIDKRLYKEYIAGSIAHTEMLLKQKIITFKIKNKAKQNKVIFDILDAILNINNISDPVIDICKKDQTISL